MWVIIGLVFAFLSALLMLLFPTTPKVSIHSRLELILPFGSITQNFL